MRIIGIVLVILGILALYYGGFTYVEDVHQADLGPLEFEVKEKERVNVPAWVGGGSVLAGLALLVYGSVRRDLP